MDPGWNEKSVFLEALGLEGAARERFLEGACPTAEARARIERLLRLHVETPAGFLESLETVVKPTGEIDPGMIEGFTIVRELGRGGMGVVYLARDLELDRLQAVKVLAQHLVGSERAIARFRHEARAVAALNHAAIVPVHRYAQVNGLQYIAMEYVEGRTLAAMLEGARAAEAAGGRGAKTGTGERDRRRAMVRMLAVVADALDHAHRRGVIHRDVKPSNIIVDAAGEPHLTDFGIAKLATEDMSTVTGERAGTVHYMSPEQAALVAATVDHRADIFSCGVVLYEAVMLRRPFEGETTHQVLDAIRLREPRGMRSVDPSIDRDLETICQKALEKRPSERYQTAAHLAADLRCYLAGDPILARPPGLVRRVRTRLRRKRGVIVAGMGVVLALACGVLAWGLMWERAAGLGTVDVRADVAESRLWVIPVDGGVRQARDLGKNAGRARLAMGQYRVVAVAPNGVFAESSVVLVTPGQVIKAELLPGRSDPNDDMVLIEGREYVVDTAASPRTVRLEAFYIDRAEVSVEEFQAFVSGTNREMTKEWTAFYKDKPVADRPVVGVSWEEAQEYARWKGKRLPTADEWESAMRSTSGELVPWMDASAAPALATIRDRDNLDFGGWEIGYKEYAAHVLPVRSHPELASKRGLFHGATNVRELTDTLLGGPSMQVVVKGASWVDDPERLNFSESMTNPVRTGEKPAKPSRSLKTGFRCARSVKPQGAFQ